MSRSRNRSRSRSRSPIMSIVDYELPYDTHNLYDVTCYVDTVRTIVTHTPSFVDEWISEIKSINSHRLDKLIVGLDVEWRPSYSRFQNPVATLQLCVGKRCLIFQIIHAPFIPNSLINFLANPNYTFVGVGVVSDVEKLAGDYDLVVANAVNLGELAVEDMGERRFINMGLKDMARIFLGADDIDKPRNITMSRWDNRWLTPKQVQYACIDAFLSFEIGVRLNAAG